MTTASDTVVKQIRQFVESQFLISVNGAELTMESDLFDAGVIDSYGLIELVAFLEKTFGIALNELDTISRDLTSIAGMARLVLTKKEAA